MTSSLQNGSGTGDLLAPRRPTAGSPWARRGGRGFAAPPVARRPSSLLRGLEERPLVDGRLDGADEHVDAVGLSDGHGTVVVCVRAVQVVDPEPTARVR